MCGFKGVDQQDQYMLVHCIESYPVMTDVVACV